MQTSLEDDRGLHPDLRAIGAAFGGNPPRVLTIANSLDLATRAVLSFAFLASLREPTFVTTLT
jgi:hypothetical protein